MPRTRKPQTAQQNRNSAVQPLQAPTGLPQGRRQQSIDSQRAVPLPDAQGRMNMAIDAAAGGAPLAGDSLMQPTALPNQPVTDGMPMGAGAGPEAVQAPIMPTTLDDERMARMLPMLEALADRPDTSDQLRNYVRRLRGTMPPSITMASITRPVQ